MLNWIVWNRTIFIKMDLASNSLQRLICHKAQPTNVLFSSLPLSLSFFLSSFFVFLFLSLSWRFRLKKGTLDKIQLKMTLNETEHWTELLSVLRKTTNDINNHSCKLELICCFKLHSHFFFFSFFFSVFFFFNLLFSLKYHSNIFVLE